MALLQTFRTLAAQETPAQRRRRMLPGLCYGLTIAGVYTLFGATINQLSYPDLPIGVDWHRLILTGALTAVWLGLGGLLTNWATVKRSIDKLKELGFQTAFQAGISIGIDDMIIP